MRAGLVGRIFVNMCGLSFNEYTFTNVGVFIFSMLKGKSVHFHGFVE